MEQPDKEWPPRSALKSVSLQQIEDALGQTITELLGKEYGVTVVDVDWTGGGGGLFQDSAKMTITVSQPSPLRDMVRETINKNG